MTDQLTQAMGIVNGYRLVFTRWRHGWVVRLPGCAYATPDELRAIGWSVTEPDE